VHGHVLVAFLEAVVLAIIVKIIPPDDDGPLHLEFLHYSREDASANVNRAGEGAFLVDVVSFRCLSRRFKPQSHRLDVSQSLLRCFPQSEVGLLVEKDSGLLLECPFSLFNSSNFA